MSELFSISRLVTHTRCFGELALEAGFSSVGDIDGFINGVYASAVKSIQPADRLRGAVFVLVSPENPGIYCDSSALVPELLKIRNEAAKCFYAISADLATPSTAIYTCTPDDQRHLVNGGWSDQDACAVSRAKKKCVVWADGVSAKVYLCGELYRETSDVIERFGFYMPHGFQELSWDDGDAIFQFAQNELNDCGDDGIWKFPDLFLLRPRPEGRIRSRLGKFLRHRLAGYRHHDEEALVEHEGRADISLHLIDDRIIIIELKWMGCSLVATRDGEDAANIKKAIKEDSKGWFTKFDAKTIKSGVAQLVYYYKTQKYKEACLAVVDCSKEAIQSQSRALPINAADLGGCNPAVFHVLCACVDPRSASKKAKANTK